MVEIKMTLPRPHPGQAAVIESGARWKVLMCGRRFGKTNVAMTIAIQKMLKGEHVAYITPEFGLGKTFFKDLLELIPPAIVRVDNKSELFIELITGGSLRFFSGEALNSMRGRRYHQIIIDEAAFIPDLESEWNTSIRPTLADYRGGCLFISTPNGRNFFHALYLKGKNKEQDYESWHYRSIDNPYFPPEEWESAKASMPSAQFAQEFEAIAGENANNPFGTENIRKCTTTTLSTNPTVVYGIDVARTHDYTVIIGLDKDSHMTHIQRFQAPWEISKQRIKSLPSNILKVMDSSGAGSVLYEQLQSETHNLIGYTFTNQSKTQMLYRLIKDVEAGNIRWTQEVADEADVFEFKYSSTGVLTFSAQSGYHDDCIMAIGLANFYKNQAVFNSTWKLYST